MSPNIFNKSIQFIQFLGNKYKTIYNDFKKNEELLDLLEKNKVQTFFQPVLSLVDGKSIGYEVLNRPVITKNFPSTDMFYDYVGESDYVFKVERYMRNLSLERYQEQLKKVGEDKDGLIFLNIHPKVLADKNYQAGTTMKLIDEYNIAPQKIILEVTEKQANIDYDEFVNVIEHYREQGFRIAIDDAGTGYNSLQTMVYLKPEILKLDRSLIRDIHTSEEKKHLLDIMLNYSYKSNTKVLAEGIETVEEYTFLEKLGVHFGQGYAIGKPKQTLINGNVPT